MNYKIFLCSLMLIVTLGCDRVEYTDASLEHHSYIWNRKTSDSISENIRYSYNFLNGYSILASEVNWVHGKARVKNSEIPKEKFAINSISIRVNDYSGNINEQADSLLEITRKALKRFKSNGFEINEIQFDFDSPSSKLGNYATLLSDLKSHFSEKLSITALPSWLKHKSFGKVLASCDNYVLQLHSLTLPKNINSISPLFDEQKADKWLLQAAKLGKDFSISLPTYGYFLGFDEQGKYLGVSSEQGPKNWPQTKVLLADSKSVNAFVQKISAKRPEKLKSIYWFRLHNEADTLNWNSDAIRSIILGNNIYIDDLEIVYDKKTPLLTDVYLRNSSSIPIILNKGETLSLQQNNILFADSLKNFSINKQSENAVKISVNETCVIPPGNSIPVCWLRSQPKEKTKS